jgi:hypothetical protein
MHQEGTCIETGLDHIPNYPPYEGRKVFVQLLKLSSSQPGATLGCSACCCTTCFGMILTKNADNLPTESIPICAFYGQELCSL